MKEFWTTIQVVFAGIGGWLGWFLGGCDGLLYALLAFVVIDYITGIMCAVVDKKLSSEVGFKGIFKKVLIFALVGIGHILDTRVIGSGSVMRTAVIFFYLSNEGVSLLENAAYLGLPIPQKLKSVLEQLHDRSERRMNNMAYTNSHLVSYTKLSPNHSGQRTHSIDRITPHCVVGQCSVETLGNIFLPTSRQASSNYGIGVDGRVGMYVEEKNRSWCSSSNANDQRAVTIECASDNTEPYAFKDVVYKRLVELCIDICKRNGKTKLLWLGDKTKTLNYTPKSDEMVLTVHRWFANKSCPGNWMYARMGELASKVTAALGSEVKPIEPTQPTGTIKAGDLVTITGSTYYNGKAIPGWVKKLRWYVVEVSGDRAVINKDESGRYAIMSPVKTSALAVAGTKPSEDYRIHTVVHGDTLWAIAKKYLGNGSRYKEIVSLNGLKSNVIYSGMKLKIPNK